MNTELLLPALALFFTLTAAALLIAGRRNSARSRLLALANLDNIPDEKQEIAWKDGADALKNLSDRLGRTGYFTEKERAFANTLKLIVIFGLTIGCCAFGFFQGKLVGAAIGLGLGIYIGLTAWLGYLSYRTRDLAREIMFQIPITLESLILLVESGLGILPAIEKVVSTKDESGERNPVTYFLKLVYELSARGMPLGQSLELVADSCDYRVLRHVFMHLDISGNEGGELIPSLRNLSSHSHLEWRLSVEHRVKRLENLVVFPVFASVMGLILLTASVPLVSVLNLRDTMEKQRQSTSISNSFGEQGQLNNQFTK